METDENVNFEIYFESSDIHIICFLGLPKGGGLYAKKVFIEEVYKKLLPEKYESTVTFYDVYCFKKKII